MNNYTHILSIQVWSDKSNISTNYGNILTRVKNAITDGIQTQELLLHNKPEMISLLWKKIKWSIDKVDLYSGDIVTYAPEIEDSVIFEHTQKMLKDVTENICLNKKFDSDYTISFSLVKPIVKEVKEVCVEFTDL